MFGGIRELDFACELGEKVCMSKAGGNAYYYIIRKLRKGMGVRKMNFELFLNEGAKTGIRRRGREIFSYDRPL